MIYLEQIKSICVIGKGKKPELSLGISILWRKILTIPKLILTIFFNVA